MKSVVAILFVMMLAIEFARELFRKRIRPAALMYRLIMAVAWAALI